MATIALTFACVVLLALAAPSRASEMGHPGDTLSMSVWSSCAIKPDGTLSCWGKDVNFAFNMPAGHYSQVSNGGDHVCAIKDDGTLVCTGSLGTSPTGTFRTVSSQSGAACAIRTDSTVACWGSNGSGETTAPSGTFIDVAMNNATSCGVKTDGTLACWGYGTPTNPVSGGNTSAMVPPSGTYVNVSVGTGRACAIKPDGTLACWGIAETTPTDSFKAIAMGDNYKCGIKVDGLLACWGSFYPWVNPPTGQFTQIVSSGGDSMCALKSDGTLACWGREGWETFGRLNPPSGSFLQPLVAVGSTFSCLVRGGDGSTLCLGSGIGTPPVGTATQITAGATYVCTLTATAFASCSGNYPVELTGIPGDLGPVLQLSAGTRHSCALKADRTVRCWGDNSSGEVAGVPSGTFRSISSGGDFSCGVKTDGALACWGKTLGGVPMPTGSFLSVSVGTSSACAVRVDGNAVCWGINAIFASPPADTYSHTSSGDLFDCGLSAARTLSCWGGTPNGETAAPSGQFVDVASGANTSCAIRATRTIACWGSNANGQGNSIAFTSSSLSTTVGGQSYNHTFTATSSIGGATVTYSLGGGTLPPGLNLASDGSLTGTPTTGGNYTFTVLAGDGVYDPAQQQNTINVDLTPPVAPSGLSTSPAGIGKLLLIQVRGTAEAGSTVRIYSTEDCDGTPLSEGSAAQFGAIGTGGGLGVVVAANAENDLYATATDASENTSGCAGPVTYTNDSIKPAPPALEATPSSPSTATALTITGSGEAGSTYRLFDGAACAGIAIGLGPIATLASGLAKTVQQNSTNVYTATLTDAAGNTSDCSAPLTFVSDQIAPEPAGSPTPIATGASTTPLITGNAEAGSTVELYLTSDCSGTPAATGGAAEFASPGIAIGVASGAATSIYATVTDGAGQSSACLLLTVYTQVTPAMPAGPSPTAPAKPLPAKPLPAKIAKPKLRSRARRGRLSVAGTVKVSAAGLRAAQCRGKLKAAVTLKVGKKTKRLASKSFALRFANGKCRASVSLKLKVVYKGKKPTFTMRLTGASALSAKQISFKQKI